MHHYRSMESALSALLEDSLLESRSLKYTATENYKCKKEEICTDSTREIAETANSTGIIYCYEATDVIMCQTSCPIDVRRRALALNKMRYNCNYKQMLNHWKIYSEVASIDDTSKENAFFLHGNLNFGHFLFEDLARASLFKKLIRDDCPVYVLGKPTFAQVALLSCFSINAENLIPLDSSKAWCFSRVMHIESQFGRDMDNKIYQTNGLAKYMRNKVTAQAKKLISKTFSKKVYLKRGITEQKRLVNETEIERYLINRGYHVIDGLGDSIWEQVKAVSEANIIVGALGASTALTLFAKDNAQVIELHPGKGVAGQYNCVHATLAHSLRYEKLIGKRALLSDNLRNDTIFWDYIIELWELESVLSAKEE